MIQLTENQTKEYNDTVEKILKILDNASLNPLIKLSILDIAKFNVTNREIIKLPEIFKNLNIKMTTLNEEK